MLSFFCSRRIYRIRETFYFNRCTLPEDLYELHSLQYQLFGEQNSAHFLARIPSFFNRNSHSCNGEQSRKKLRRNCSLLEKRMHPLDDNRPQIQNQYPPKQTCFPTSSRGCLQRFLHNCKQMMCKSKLPNCAYFQQLVCICLVYTKYTKKW